MPVTEPDQEQENLLWAIWKDLEADLKLRETFVPLDLLRSDPNCQALFSPVPQLAIPPGANQQVMQAIVQLYFQQNGLSMVPPSPFENTLALMESVRRASRMRISGSIFAARQHDLEMKITVAPEKIGWIDVALPLPGPGEVPPPDPGAAPPLV